MSSLSRMTGAGAILLGTLIVGACAPKVSTQGSATSSGTTTTAQGNVDPAQPVKLALMIPLSAQQQSAAQLGRALSNAAQMAMKEVGDPKLTLAVYDTGGNPSKARAVAEQAIREKAALFIGPLLGSSTKAVAAPAAKGGLKVISFSTDTTAAGDPVYLSGFAPETAARRVVGYARSQGYGQLGVFYPQTAYGAQAIKGAQAAGAGAIVASTQYPRTNEGLPPAATSFAQQVQTSGARAVLLAESGQALGFVGGLMAQNGVRNVKYLGLGEWNSPATLAARPIRGGWFAAPDPRALRSFVEKYQASYGNVPPSLAVLSYDAVKIAAQMVREARANGNRSPFSTQSLTRGGGFRGAVGPIRFNPNGTASRAMAILEVGERTFRTIDPAPVNLGAGS
ncbi:MAG: penicillin-binding protein activator [Pseudomonadota bacterium]